MITSKIDAIKRVRAFVEYTFGVLPGLRETKDFVEATLIQQESTNISGLVDEFRRQVGGTGSMGEYISPTRKDILRENLRAAYRKAIGEEL